jgi:hypothetical protein
MKIHCSKIKTVHTTHHQLSRGPCHHIRVVMDLGKETDFLRKSFVSTGFLIAKDGSENGQIVVPGVPDYDFTSPCE